MVNGAKSLGRVFETDVISGYVASPFPLKASQQAQVTQILTQSGFMPQELVSGEVDWFYNGLGIDNAYL